MKYQANQKVVLFLLFFFPIFILRTPGRLKVAGKGSESLKLELALATCSLPTRPGVRGWWPSAVATLRFGLLLAAVVTASQGFPGWNIGVCGCN